MTRRTSWASFILYVALAFAITWLSWLPGVLQNKSIFTISMPLTLLGGMGPAIAALVATAIMEGRDGLKWLGRRLIQGRVPVRWYLVALLLPLACALIAMTGEMAFTGAFRGFRLPDGGWGATAAAIISSYLLQTLLTGGNEELGWRGFALPSLQARFSAFTSSLILAVIWALWHLPLFFMSGTFQSRIPFFMFFLFTLPLTMVFTWIHNGTGGSILLVMLFHGAVNTTAALVQSSMTDTAMIVTWAVVAAVVVLVAGPTHMVRLRGKVSKAA